MVGAQGCTKAHITRIQANFANSMNIKRCLGVVGTDGEEDILPATRQAATEQAKS